MIVNTDAWYAEQYEHYVLDQHSRSVAKWLAFVFRLN